jgi:hypothetical protein
MPKSGNKYKSEAKIFIAPPPQQEKVILPKSSFAKFVKKRCDSNLNDIGSPKNAKDFEKT